MGFMATGGLFCFYAYIRSTPEHSRKYVKKEPLNSRECKNLISITIPSGHISGSIVTAKNCADEMFVTIPYDKFACIDLVIVLPKCRREDWGSRLIRKFMARAKTAGAEAVLAELLKFNGAVTVEARRAFFEKQGLKMFPVNEEEHDSPPLLMIAEI